MPLGVTQGIQSSMPPTDSRSAEGLGRGLGLGIAKERNSIERQRLGLLGRQEERAQQAQVQQQAQERVSQTLGVIDQMIKSADASGRGREKAISAARQMLQTLQPIAEAGYADWGTIQGQFDSIIGQPTPQQIAEQEAMKKAMETKATEMAKARVAEQFTPEFQTDPGKVLADVRLAERLYGVGSEQAMALREAQDAPEEADIKDETGVRKEFTKLSSDFIKVRDAHTKIVAAGDNPTAAGDLALMFNYMKMLDPGSVVRESEFAQIAATGSMGERLKAGALRFLSGERLSPAMRKDFIDRSETIMASQLESQKKLENQFRGLAERLKMKPENVVIDFTAPPQPQKKDTRDEMDKPAASEGTIIENAEGDRMILRNGEWQPL